VLDDKEIRRAYFSSVLGTGLVTLVDTIVVARAHLSADKKSAAQIHWGIVKGSLAATRHFATPNHFSSNQKNGDALAAHLLHQHSTMNTAALTVLPLKQLQGLAASLGITTPAGHKGKKATWIAAIQAAALLLLREEPVVQPYSTEQLTEEQTVEFKEVGSSLFLFGIGGFCSCKRWWRVAILLLDIRLPSCFCNVHPPVLTRPSGLRPF
jgi:hypothetical protein